MSDEDVGPQFAKELLLRARSVIAEHHDVIDSDSPLVQLPNWAMRATNAIDEALAEISRANPQGEEK